MGLWRHEPLPLGAARAEEQAPRHEQRLSGSRSVRKEAEVAPRLPFRTPVRVPSVASRNRPPISLECRLATILATGADVPISTSAIALRDGVRRAATPVRRLSQYGHRKIPASRRLGRPRL